MKKAFLYILIFTCDFYAANAQKAQLNTNVVAKPKIPVLRALPDLTFGIVPGILSNSMQKIASKPNSVTVPAKVHVKNIGTANSKATKVYVQIKYWGTSTLAGGREPVAAWQYIYSDKSNIPPIEHGREILLDHVFTFNNIPAKLYGTNVTMSMHIEVMGRDNVNEISVSNNSSAELVVDMIE